MCLEVRSLWHADELVEMKMKHSERQIGRGGWIDRERDERKLCDLLTLLLYEGATMPTTDDKRFPESRKLS